MHHAAHALGAGRGIAPPLHAEQVDAAARGERRQGRVGTGKGGGHDADGERHDHPRSQRARGHEPGQQFVAGGGGNDAARRTQGVQQDAKEEEKEVDGQKREAVGAHVLLRLTQRAAGQVFLHHVLVEPGHDDDDKGSAQKLPPESLRALRVPHEDVAVRAFTHKLHQRAPRQGELPHGHGHDAREGQEHAERLQGVGAHQGADAAAVRVAPDEQEHREHREGEGAAQRAGHKLLEHEADEIEARGGARELGEEEEKGRRAVRRGAEAGAGVGIDAREAQAVVERQEDEGHGGVAHDEAHAHLQIAHAGRCHPAGHGDERHAGDAGPDHAESHHPPWRLATGAEKVVVAPAPALTPRHGEEQGEIGRQREHHEKSRIHERRRFSPVRGSLAPQHAAIGAEQKGGRREKAYGKGQEDAADAQVEGKAEQIAAGDTHAEVTEYGYPHHGQHVARTAQGVGVANLHGVAKLIDHQGEKHEQGHRAHVGVGAEDGYERRREAEERERGQHGEQQLDVAAGGRGQAHALPVLDAHERGDADGHACPKTIIEQEAQRAERHDDLIGCQLGGAQPAGHDGAEREGARFNAHLQRNGERLGRHIADALPRQAGGAETGPIGGIAPPHRDETDEEHGHEETGEQRADAGAEQPHLRKGAHAPDEQPVAHDVQQVAGQERPHAARRVGGAVGKLAQGVEHHHKKHGDEDDNIVGTHLGKQFGGLPQTVEEEIEPRHDGHDDSTEKEVGREGVFQQGPGLGTLATAVERADHRREPVGIAHDEELNEIENIRNERRGRQRRRGILAHHHRVGKAQNNDAQLAYGNGQAQAERRFIMGQQRRKVRFHNGCKGTHFPPSGKYGHPAPQATSTTKEWRSNPTWPAAPLPCSHAKTIL